MDTRIPATAAIILFTLLTWSAAVPVAASTDLQKRCAASPGGTIVLAAPQRYEQALPSGIADRWCVVITHGSEYQVLDWLENGKVDGAIVSPFSLKLIELETAGRFNEQYRVFDEYPFGDGQLESAGYALRFWRDGRWQADPQRHYVDNLEHGDGRAPIPVHAESHLSPGLLALLHYAARWTGDSPYGGDPGTWKRFVVGLRFDLEPGGRTPAADAPPRFQVLAVENAGTRACSAPELACLGTTGLRDYLVVHAHVDLPMQGRLGRVRPDHEALAWLERFHDEEQLDELDPSLRDFYRKNYQQHSIDFRKRRHFRFTLDETWKILATHETPEQNDELALVLTGGGVKAGYQTELVDHLYNRGYLRNVLATEQEPSAHTQRVDYVIGTSGGALLGLVVAVLDGPLSTGLSDLVWKTNGRYLDSTDVFPFIEMLRYATVVYAGIIFALICALLLASKKVRALLVRDETTIAPGIAHGGDLAFTMVWIVLLAVSPWMLKWVMGEAALEHVPVIAGVFYTLYIYIAVYSDNRLNLGNGPPEDRTGPSLPLWIAFAIGAVMALAPMFATFGPSWLQRQLELGLLGTVTPATLICCTGFLVLALAYHRHRFRMHRAQPTPLRPLVYAAAIIIAFPIVAYLPVAAAGVSLFELKPELWGWYGVSAAVLTLVLLLLARWQRVPAIVRRPLAEGFDLLFERHPRRTLFARARRYARAVLFLSLAWVWWNFVNAPAIYGNQQAQRHFAQTLERFELAAGGDEIEFKTPFIISATSLDKAREVYFMVFPDTCDPQSAALAPTPNWLTIRTDPRWIEISPDLRRIDEQSELTELGKVAFASGSPFPVFPMTRIEPLARNPDCAKGSEDVHDPDSEPGGEWLVDGGYAHNIPVNAASQVGAGRILVISSSPLHPLAEEDREGISTYTIGRLILGIPRLFPYLWQRSQIEDALSTEDMLVVALSPALDEGEDWPFLVDFQGHVIRDVVAKARDNLTNEHRIGTVESWGPPVCRLDGVELACTGFQAVR